MQYGMLLSAALEQTFQMTTSENILDPSNWAGAYDRVALIAPIVFWIVSTMCSVTGLFGIAQTVFGFAAHVIVGIGENFWSEVDEAHKQKLTIKRNGGGNQVVETFKSGKYLIMSFIPNLRAMTTYNETIDMKRFWIEFIPKTFMMLGLSLFVYFGNTFILVSETKDVAITVSRMIEDNIDLAGMIEKIPSNIHIKEFNNSGNDSPEAKIIVEIAGRVTSRIYTEYKDITKDSRKAVDLSVENWIESDINSLAADGLGMADLVDSTRYGYAIELISGTGEPANSTPKTVTGLKGKMHTFTFYSGINAFNTGLPESTIDPTKYIGYRLIFREVAQDVNANATYTFTLKTSVTSGSTEISFSVPTGWDIIKGANATLSWDNGEFSAPVSAVTGQKITAVPPKGSSIGNNIEITLGGLTISQKDGSGNGTGKITKIISSTSGKTEVVNSKGETIIGNNFAKKPVTATPAPK